MKTISEKWDKIVDNELSLCQENLKNLKCESCMWFNKEFRNCKRYDVEKKARVIMEYNCNKYMKMWKQI